ncbi:MAG: cytochrome b/b6 domain-containing protein [Thermoanaerobaculia bacterium]
MTGETAAGPARRYVKRFDPFDRFLHFLMMVTFLGLSLTGLPLFFSTHRWAAVLANALGGFRGAGLLHRIFATGILACFVMHLARLAYRLVARRDWGILWGPDSLVPQPRDLVQMYQNFRWFLGLGPRPRFDRYTYWEKFDYWAVFWGMAIIGGSGLLLWFPQFFTRVLPGTVFNLALLIHGEEALLAVSFIFTIHFFNSHLRPEKFPVDRVIFTGVVAEDELRAERPAEYARIQASGGLDALSADPPSPRALRRADVSAIVAVAIGLTLVVLTIFALLT